MIFKIDNVNPCNLLMKHLFCKVFQSIIHWIQKTFYPHRMLSSPSLARFWGSSPRWWWRLVTGQSCGAVICDPLQEVKVRSHVRLPGVRVVTHCKNGGSNILIEYLCYALYSPSQKKGAVKGEGDIWLLWWRERILSCGL